MDLLVRNGTVITCDPARRVWLQADVLIQGGRIARIGKRLSVSKSARTLDADGRLVLPGLVHGHLHACQTLFRNQADGLELLDWLSLRIWPMEAAHTRASMRASADLTFLELLKSGGTAALDMGTVGHYDAVFESARDCGIRLVGGKAMMDAGDGVPAKLQESTQSSLKESLRLLERWHGAEDGRLRYAFAPRFVLSCTEALLVEVARLAREKQVRIHTHASENVTECALVRAQTGQGNIAYFHQVGVAGPHVTLAHCVHVDASERALLRKSRTVVCHCPSSNLKLASGVAPLPELLDEKIAVALGPDGAPCNNNLDLFTEMRLAALLHKPRMGPLAVPAQKVLDMATLGGARALGLEKEIGSLEVGKRADLIVVDRCRPHVTPLGEDPVAQLVYSGQARDVRHVVVDGKVVVRDRRAQTLDEAAVVGQAKRWAARLARAIR